MPADAAPAARCSTTPAAAELAALGARIEEHFGAPQDIEWARAGGEFFILQSRPITALPEPAADTPTDWTVPDPTALYFRASIVEQLPDPLSPLFADLIDGSVTRSLQALIGEAARPRRGPRRTTSGCPRSTATPTTATPAARCARMMRQAPPAARALRRAARRSTVRRRAGANARTRATPRWSTAGAEPRRPSSPARELLDGRASSCWTPAPSTTPRCRRSSRSPRPARSPSPASTTGSSGAPATRPPPTFLLGFDSEPIRAEKSLYDLAALDPRAARSWPRRCRPRPSADAGRLAARRRAAGRRRPGAVAGVAAAVPATTSTATATPSTTSTSPTPVPADDPAPLLDTLRFYLRGEGTDPHERQRRLGRAPRGRRPAERSRPGSDPARRAAFDRLLRWAQGIAPVREDALADVGLAWPQLRRMLLELGSGWSAPACIDRARRRVLAAPRAEIAGGAARRGRRTERRPVARARGAIVARPAPGHPPAAAARAPLDRACFESDDAGGSHEQTGDVLTGHRRQRRPGHRTGPGARRARGLRPDAARRRAGRPHHHAGLDLAVRHGRRPWSPTSAGR